MFGVQMVPNGLTHGILSVVVFPKVAASFSSVLFN